MLTPWLLIPLVAFCTNVALAAYALHVDWRHPVNRLFSLTLGCMAWWSLMLVLGHTVVDPAAYTLVMRISAPAWIFLGPLVLHMVLVLTADRPLLRSRPAYALAYVPGLALLWLRVATPLLYTEQPMQRPWGYQGVPGPWFWTFAVYTGLFTFGAIVPLVARTLRATTATERARFICLTLGALTPALGGSISSLFLPLLGFQPYYGTTLALTPLMGLFFAVGIFRYRLLEPTLLRSASQVLQHMSQPVFLVGPDNTVLEANEAAEALTGRSLASLSGKPLAGLLTDGPAAWEAVLAARDEEGNVASVDLSWRTAQGHDFPMLLSLTTLRVADGDLQGYLLFGTDYSDVQRAQRALAESEELYRTLHDNSVLGVILGWETVVQANDQAAALLGTTVADLIGRRPDEFWPDTQPDGRSSAAVAAEKRRAAMAGQPQFFLWRHQRLDGALIDCEMSMNAVTLGGQRLAQMTMRDVTEQRRVEEAIQYLHQATADVVGTEFFNALVQHLAQWLGMTWAQIGEIDPDDPDTVRVLAMWHDGTAAEPCTYVLPGSPCADVLHSGFRQFSAGVAARYPDDTMLAEEGIESYVGIPLCDPDGGTIGLLCAMDTEPLHVSPQLVETLFKLFAARVSAELMRLRAEAQEREHAEQLRELQKVESVGLLAGGVAHDFNNILVGVLGHASLVREALPPESPVHRSLTVIEDSAERAVGLTSQLLAYARGGKQNPVPVDLRTLVGDMLDMLGAVLPKSVTVQCVLPDGIPPVFADPSQMQQIVMNLCTNAGEAMGDGGGTLTVRLGTASGPAHCPHVSEAPSAQQVVLAVSDTGCGMPPEVRRRMYEPFFSTKGFGRGLGLAAAQGIALNHGGCLHCESAPGAGTTFQLYMPAHDAPVAAAPPVEATPAPNGTETILVADDEAVVREFARDVLADLGYHVLAAETGTEALAIYRARQTDIDLVLLDMIMPGLNGLETLEALQALNPRVKAILTSGYAQDQIPGGPNDVRPTAFLKKPYRCRTLSDVVRAALA